MKDYRILKSCREDKLQQEMSEHSQQGFAVEQFSAVMAGSEVLFCILMSKNVPDMAKYGWPKAMAGERA